MKWVVDKLNEIKENMNKFDFKVEKELEELKFDITDLMEEHRELYWYGKNYRKPNTK